jgi:uncharacterized membrane protein
MKEQASGSGLWALGFAHLLNAALVILFASFAIFAVKAFDRKVRKGRKEGVKGRRFARA